MTPFRIIPWNEDFLEACRRIIDEQTDGRPGRAVIVFPHSRPRRYLTDLYRNGCRRPMLLPRMMTGEELRDQFRAAWDAGGARIARRADRLDQTALLRRSVARVAEGLPENSPLRGLNDADGMARFYPWGTRLADLMEECLHQMVDATDLRHAEGEVAPFAAALLGELRAIRGDYLASLATAGLSTPGLDAHFVARQASLPPDQRPPLPGFLRNRTLILAGFVSLTRAEDLLFRHLWEQGAIICLHTDPAVAEGGGHWSCADHLRWIRRWKARTDVDSRGPAESAGPRFHFFAGYDLHSQLQELRRVLSAGENDGATETRRAVVLPHASLLMPALHHLPRKDINISLGYPLDRSLLARLLDTVMRVRESLRADGRHHWRPLRDLFRHPYVRMLRTVLPAGDGDPADGFLSAENASSARAGEEEGTSLRPLLRLLDRRLRTGSRLADLSVLLPDLLDDTLGDLDSARPGDADLTEEAGELLEKTARILVDAWNDVTTLRGVAHRLAAVCDLLLTHGRHIWPRFPIDAECLFRLMQSLIPSLMNNAMADDPLPAEALFAIVRQSLSDERVPFEADPLTGLQVLGMLETRLLRFDSVFLLDLTDDRLPGSPRNDPLLPDNLRGLLGLPDTGRRDALAAHTFHRLLSGARDVWLFWQEGVESSGLLDSKKVRSRLVEKTLWDMEQSRGRRLRSGEDPLLAATFPLAAPPAGEYLPIPKTPTISARLEALLSDPLSPTRLDAYLRCPVRFFHEQVCRIRPLEEVVEGDDPARVGELLHRALMRAYDPYVGETVGPAEKEDLSRRLPELFREELEAGDLGERLPAESRIMLEAAGPLRLLSFLNAQPEDTILIQVEQEHQAVLDVRGRRRILRGVLDRVDRREGRDIILDYKSGRHPRSPAAAFWTREDLWDAVTDWDPERGDPLPDVADALPSIQLPCYLYLWGQDPGRRPGDAAWVPLAGDGREVPLLGPSWDDADREAILGERIPTLIRFVLDHMKRAPAFVPRPGAHCRHCPCPAACRGTRSGKEKDCR